MLTWSTSTIPDMPRQIQDVVNADDPSLFEQRLVEALKSPFLPLIYRAKYEILLVGCTGFRISEQYAKAQVLLEMLSFLYEADLCLRL